MSSMGFSKTPFLLNQVHTYLVYHTYYCDDIVTNTLKLYTSGEGLKQNPSSAASTRAMRISSRYNDAFIVPQGSNG